MNVPLAVGVPLIVITFAAQAALTPAGRPVAAPTPVALVVLWVMLVKAVLMQSVGVEEAALAVFIAVTVTVIAVEPLTHPLVLFFTIKFAL